MTMEVRALCRVCKNVVPASQFRLHHEYKQMVCTACYSGKTKEKEQKEAAAVLQKPEAPPKPPGWDAEETGSNPPKDSETSEAIPTGS